VVSSLSEEPRVPGIGVITNPRSKVNKRDPSQMRQLGYLLGTRGSAEATRSIDDLYRAAEEFKAADIDILGINGGDGTIHVTLTAFLKVYGDAPLPRVALLRGGTLNTIARGLGIAGDSQRLLYEVIDRYHQNEEMKTREQAILQIGDRYGFIFGNGMVANFLEAYYGTGHPSPTQGALLVLRAIGSAFVRGKLIKKLFRRFVGRITVDGEAWSRPDFATLIGSTVPEIGLGFKIFKRCYEKPGHFAFVGIHSGPLGTILDLPRIHRGKGLRRDRAISVVAREIKIESEEPWHYTIDGDLYRDTRELVIKTGPTLQVIVPELPRL
jgi:diacylglycerol kinase (ATP)